MENYYGGPKGLQGIQGEQGIKGFNFFIKGIIQENTYENINKVLDFKPNSADLPSFEENKWFIYYFPKVPTSFGYSQDKDGNIHKIFLGYENPGFWKDNGTDQIKFSMLDKNIKEKGNINLNFITFEQNRNKILNNFLVKLQKYLAGWDVQINLEVADVDNDGKVSKSDLLRFQKYMEGQDVEINPKTLQYLNNQIIQHNLKLNYTKDNQIKTINLLSQFNQEILSPSNLFDVMADGDCQINLLETSINNWNKSLGFNDNFYIYTKNYSVEPTPPPAPTKTVTFYIKSNDLYFNEFFNGGVQENTPELVKDTIVATIGNTMSDVESQSSIISYMNTVDHDYYSYSDTVNGNYTVYTIGGSDASQEGDLGDVLRPSDIIDASWDGIEIYVIGRI